jgi:hypothetical protein
MHTTIALILMAAATTTSQAQDLEDKRFPDGMVRDFGAVPYGTQLRHDFRIVNTSKFPIRIREVRLS